MELFFYLKTGDKGTFLTSQEPEAEQQSEPTSSVWSCLLFVPLQLNIGHAHTGFKHASPVLPREREQECRPQNSHQSLSPVTAQLLGCPFPCFSIGFQYTRKSLIISIACLKFLYNFYLNYFSSLSYMHSTDVQQLNSYFLALWDS